MVKRNSLGKNFIRKIKARKNSKNRKQRGGKIVLPQRYFNDQYTNHYYTQDELVQSGRNNPNAISHGVSNGTTDTVGGNHIPGIGLNPQKGGAPLPAEYFGGSSGRYFEAGSPELENCTTAYGISVPTSHGVVMGGKNAGWMGPNLAPYPNHSGVMTGGKRKSKRKYTKKRKNSKKSKNNKKKKTKSKRLKNFIRKIRA